MGRVEGKVAVITGGGSGIGEACAVRLAREGAEVAVVDIAAAGAERVAAAIVAAGGRAVPVVADVSDEDDVRRMVATTVSEFGRLDVLHNNAALVAHEVFRRDRTVTEMDLEVWEAIMAVNLRGPMLGTKHAVPVMIDGGGGSIVNMSSGSSQLGDIERSAYGASKAGLNALTLYTATQYGRDGVRANADPARPDPDAGGRHEPACRRAGDRREQRVDAVRRRARRHRPPVTYLASDESRYVTGQLFPVNGGQSSHQPTYAQRNWVGAR